MAPVTYRSAFPIIYSEDIPAALRFYRDLLGFRVTFAFPDDGVPRFAALELEGGSELGLADVAARDAVHLHGQDVHPRSGLAFELCIYASDVDAAVATLRAAGVSVLTEPADQPWGERLAYVADPGGNPVMICAPLTPER